MNKTQQLRKALEVFYRKDFNECYDIFNSFRDINPCTFAAPKMSLLFFKVKN